MPTYEYRCTKCGQHLEVYQAFTEEPLKRHASCGGKLNKVFGSVGIVLKGSGFYRTDSRADGGRKAGKPAEKADGASGTSGESSARSAGTTAEGGAGGRKPDASSA